MSKDYSQGNYKPFYKNFNRKRQVIDAMVNDLHNMQMDMIEQALVKSDLHEANEVINYIKGKL
jgi:hypothetical protein